MCVKIVQINVVCFYVLQYYFNVSHFIHNQKVYKNNTNAALVKCDQAN